VPDVPGDVVEGHPVLAHRSDDGAPAGVRARQHVDMLTRTKAAVLGIDTTGPKSGTGGIPLVGSVEAHTLAFCDGRAPLHRNEHSKRAPPMTA
jgi:hypothetical protein